MNKRIQRIGAYFKIEKPVKNKEQFLKSDFSSERGSLGGRIYLKETDDVTSNYIWVGEGIRIFYKKCYPSKYFEESFDELKINSKEFIDKSIQFIETNYKQRESKNLLVPLSGGVDSAVVANLCKKTGLETKCLTITDKKFMRPEDYNDAIKITKYLGLPHEIIDATKFYKEVYRNNLNLNSTHTMMGFRTALINSVGERDQSVIISGHNLSEFYSGMFCLNNVLGGEIFPLSKLYKTQIYQIANRLNLPEDIKTKISHGGIRGALDDEAQMGITFEEFDVIAYSIMDKRLSNKKISSLLKYPLETVKQIRENIEKNKTKVSFPELCV